MSRWFAVVRGAEIGPRHVVHIQLLGQEIALWRDDAGTLNAFENRCPHRGVRLSVGINTGTELRCQYHGWRFASGSGRCTFIPAHPTQSPASTLGARVFAVVERDGYAWINLDPDAAATTQPPTLSTGPALILRSIFAEAPLTAMTASLRPGYAVFGATKVLITSHDEFTLSAAATADGILHTVTFLLQPVTRQQTLLHARLEPEPPGDRRLSVLHYHNAQMRLVRDAAESLARAPTSAAVE
jgi:nitrite reductase/ring-hydroxylating ferredoxin subunit